MVRPHKPLPKKAIKDPVSTHMREVIKKMFIRRVALIPFDLTHEECIELIADEDIIPLLMTAGKHADFQASKKFIPVHIPELAFENADHSRVNTYIMMRTHGKKEPPLIPRNVRWHPGTPGAEKIIRYITQWVALNLQYACATEALNCLIRLCETGQQVRYLWPPVLHLCTALDKSASGDPAIDWGERHAEFKKPTWLPALTQPMRAVLQEGTKAITASALIGSDPCTDPDIDREVAINANAWSMLPDKSTGISVHWICI